MPAEIDRLTSHIRALAAEECRPLAVLLTHHHLDHVGGARAVSEQLGIPVWCHARTADRLPFRADRLLEEGDELVLAGAPAMRWRVLHTPGHARGHLCLVDDRDPCGGGGRHGGRAWGPSSSIRPRATWPSTCASSRGCRDLPVRAVYPAHGPPLPDGPSALAAVLDHRAMRERRVQAALAPMARPLEELAAAAYADTPSALPYLAERSTFAILEKLRGEGVGPGDGRGLGAGVNRLLRSAGRKTALDEVPGQFREIAGRMRGGGKCLPSRDTRSRQEGGTMSRHRWSLLLGAGVLLGAPVVLAEPVPGKACKADLETVCPGVEPGQAGSSPASWARRMSCLRPARTR